jgi:hypothetical protein
LADRIRDPQNQFQAEIELASKRLVTNYGNKLAYVRVDEFSRGNAWNTMAFNGFLRVRVQQYFYIKHGVKLNYPKLPMVVQIDASKNRYYYPIELLVVVDDAPKKECKCRVRTSTPVPRVGGRRRLFEEEASSAESDSGPRGFD